jgi:hypothetical protein
MPRCDGIKQDGMACAARLNGDAVRCGKHSHDKFPTPADELAAYRKYVIDRIRWLCQPQINYNNRNVLRTRAEFAAMTLPELFVHADTLADNLRPDYPDYPGQFIKKSTAYLMTFKPLPAGDDRADAELRARNAGHGGEHNIRLLHEWMSYFRTTVNQIIPVTLDQCYDVDYVRVVLSPAIVNNWARFDNIRQKPAIRRCCENLLILGQTHIALIEADLPRVAILAGAAFMADGQNVHRSQTVKHVTDLFAKLMEIPIPAEQNTLGEVITKCQLPPQAIVQLTRHYCEPVSIYEIPKAYPKALDAVWAYIRNHIEKKELYLRVKDELTDNIGMCAQGNLSRICNIVSGYLDGIQPIVSVGEQLQRLISAIARDSEDDKIRRAQAALRELAVPEAEWAPWIEALADM